MKRIICHWTAGTHKANNIDLSHYHYVYEGDGTRISGKHPISANASGKPLRTGKYAAHTRSCNTDSIGLSLACMAGAQENVTHGPYPMTRAQFEAMCKDIAVFCKTYDIEVTDKTVLSHAEVEKNLGIKQAGKWDYTVLPFEPQLRGAKQCGDYLRERVLHYMKPVEVIRQPATAKPVTNVQPVQPKKTLWQWLRSLFGA